jgi:hypothetical protein
LLVLLIRWNIVSPAFQGRLLFPALGAITVLWAVGLLALVRPSFRPKLALGIGLVALAIATLLPWLSIRPAYAYPQPLASVPESARFGPITFQAGDGVLQLAGVQVPPEQTTTPGGEPIEVTLFWQALEPVGQDYLSNVHVLGREMTSVGQVNRYPGGGMIPTSMWQPGQIWRDVYHVNVSRDAQAPARLQIKTGLFDTELEQDLQAVGPGEQTIDLLLIGEARLANDDQQSEPPAADLNISFAEGITLLGYDLSTGVEGQMVVSLHWSASDQPAADYTVFVHLLDAEGGQIAGGDGPPLYGDYPTGMWRNGDVIVDEHRLLLPADLAPGDYQVAVGLYDPLTLARLARLDGGGDTVRWPVVFDGER